jgi:hypothetical protein
MVQVIYSGLIQQTFGLTRESIPIDAQSTVRDLLLAVAQRHGEAMHEALFVGDGKLVPNAIVLLDGRDIRQRQGTRTLIGTAERLELLLLPPATGGG